MVEAIQHARTIETRRFALLLLGFSVVACVPAFLFLGFDLRVRHAGLLAMLFACGICASRADIHIKTKVPLKVDGACALVILAVVLSGPIGGVIVFLPWEIASRLIWRENKIFTPGALANLASYGWSALAAAETLKLAGVTTLAPHAATSVFTATIVLGVVQFAIARFVYGTLYQGYRTWPLVRSEFPELVSISLVEAVLAVITVALVGVFGVFAFAPLALIIVVPSLLVPALSRSRSVQQLDQRAATALYATAIADVMCLSRDRRRVIVGATHLLHRAKHARSARWSDLHEIEFAAMYATERYDGSGRPAGLAGTHIPLDSRILAAASKWAGLTAAGSQRLPHSEALLALELAAGAELDPHVVAAAGEIVNAELPFARDSAFRPVLHTLPLPRALRRDGLPHALAGLNRTS